MGSKYQLVNNQSKININCSNDKQWFTNFTLSNSLDSQGLVSSNQKQCKLRVSEPQSAKLYGLSGRRADMFLD